MERVFRQLEKLEESLEHLNIETAIESRLPRWILKKIYQQREEDSKLDDDGKYPTYLPKDHSTTELLIQQKHEELCRAGNAHTLSELRREFWILKERIEIKKILNQCMACKCWNPKSSYHLCQIFLNRESHAPRPSDKLD
uniref:Integrase_H2C2 domain-containing protein n=1 Tax=Loa loa TaxID=7209 RepID=A0A1I7VAS2_LOALO